MKLSVVIPAHDEEGEIERTLGELRSTLDGRGLDYEIVVVDDASTDGTAAILGRLAAEDDRIRLIPSPHEPGFGFAVRAGLEAFEGDAVAIFMADGSDSPEDLSDLLRTCSSGVTTARSARASSRAVGLWDTRAGSSSSTAS